MNSIFYNVLKCRDLRRDLRYMFVTFLFILDY